MRMYVNIMWILYLLLLVKICETRKSRNKQRVKVQRSKDIDTQLNSMSLQELIKKICLPPQFNRLVYRYQNNSYIFIGFDDVEKETVYSMTWKINKFNQEALVGINRNRFTVHPAAEIRKEVKYNHLLAAANKNIQDKFQENISMCGQSKITSKACIIQSFSVLARKMKEVTFGEKCQT
ncbi:uncharacterized protein LOC132737594 [Ruditapes philippinarum]|uniref:uncharacterized protein LOC132737594 n=1 Tax=Ruditapes philippinarum TaxID=129788 RepID=UPI00295A9034|nr:uncharacterized protein LOC132737594 [Ruditapes philippinarum]XP_060580896.1 uncharacterized protein LOC132737594 [Ruditapes philippinarum]